MCQVISQYAMLSGLTQRVPQSPGSQADLQTQAARTIIEITTCVMGP